MIFGFLLIVYFILDIGCFSVNIITNPEDTFFLVLILYVKIYSSIALKLIKIMDLF